MILFIFSFTTVNFAILSHNFNFVWLLTFLEIGTEDLWYLNVCDPTVNKLLSRITDPAPLTTHKQQKKETVRNCFTAAGCFEVACTVKSIKIKFEKYSRKLHYSRRGVFCSNRPPILQALKCHHFFLFGYNALGKVIKCWGPLGSTLTR